jgi:hypothetical protein
MLVIFIASGMQETKMLLHIHTANKRKALSDMENDGRLPARLGPWVCDSMVNVNIGDPPTDGINPQVILAEVERFGFFLFPPSDGK